MKKEKAIVIIPTYNEEAVIEETITQVFNVSKHISAFEVHILIFDSASRDQTQLKVKALQNQYPYLHLISELQKTGLGSAYLQAMRYAINTLKADLVVEFDADLSHQPRYLIPMLECIKTCDTVVGSRYIVGGSIPKKWGWHRKLFSTLGNIIARTLLTFKYKDFTSGFRISRTSFLQQILPTRFLTNHYAYKLELFWLLHKAKAQIIEFPIQFIDREKGQSKLPKNCVIDSLKVLFILRFKEMKCSFKILLFSVSNMIHSLRMKITKNLLNLS